MKTSIINANRSVFLAGAAATLAIAAMAFAGGAQARDNLTFSVGIASPGVQVGVTNAYPVYQQPVYVQPAPVYVQPRPVYVQPAPIYVPRPVYYAPPVYVAPQPVYQSWGHHKRHRDNGRHLGHQGYQGYQSYQGHHGYQGYQQAPQVVYTPRPTYAPVYYQR